MSFDRFSEGETFIVDYWFLKTYCGSFDQALINRKMFLPNDRLVGSASVLGNLSASCVSYLHNTIRTLIRCKILMPIQAN